MAAVLEGLPGRLAGDHQETDLPVDPAIEVGSLLDRRLIIVTGKGGTGKTTVSACLALAAAQRGQRVLVAEIARSPQVARLLDPNAPEVGYEAQRVGPGIHVMRIDPFAALAEFIGLQVGLRQVAERVLRSRGFRQLMEASPGWRELITLGKVWHMEQMREDGEPLYDLIVVDAPATGHGVALLEVPRVVVSAVRAGPLRHHTERVEALIEDASRTLLLPVARAEELPARETAQLVHRVRDQLALHVDRVVVNAVHEPPFPPALGDLDERLARLPQGDAFGALPGPATLVTCGRYLRARYELNRGYVAEIARTTGLPVVCLPYLRDGLRDVHDVSGLAASLLAAPGSAP